MNCFFFDIDSTFAVGKPGEQHILDSTKIALKKLKENGHFLAIATGRGYAMAKEIMESLGFENMVSDGGNGITINNKLISIEPLNYQNALNVIDECKQKGYPWGFSPDNSKQRLTSDERFYEFTHDIYMPTIVVDNLDPRDYKEIYKVYVACYYPEEYILESLNHIPWCRYHDEYLFCEPIDKAVGIKKIVDYFQGNYKDVVVFGDGENDLSMFCEEWTSISMGNACDKLKEKATYITDDCDKDGIYNACVHFNWI